MVVIRGLTDAKHDAARVEHRGVHIAVRDCVTDPIGPDLGFYAARS
jgi:hypothetical protein